MVVDGVEVANPDHLLASSGFVECEFESTCSPCQYDDGEVSVAGLKSPSQCDDRVVHVDLKSHSRGIEHALRESDQQRYYACPSHGGVP